MPHHPTKLRASSWFQHMQLIKETHSNSSLNLLRFQAVHTHWQASATRRGCCHDSISPSTSAIPSVPRSLLTGHGYTHAIRSYIVIILAVCGEIAVCTSSIRHLHVAYNLYTQKQCSTIGSPSKRCQSISARVSGSGHRFELNVLLHGPHSAICRSMATSNTASLNELYPCITHKLMDGEHSNICR